MWIDSHCHIDVADFDHDRAEAVLPLIGSLLGLDENEQSADG